LLVDELMQVPLHPKGVRLSREVTYLQERAPREVVLSALLAHHARRTPYTPRACPSVPLVHPRLLWLREAERVLRFNASVSTLRPCEWWKARPREGGGIEAEIKGLLK
jgi:hypothetical protein